MSVMDRIDRLMLIVAKVTLGVLLLENIVPIFAKWIIPFLDHCGLPHISAPLQQIILLMFCLWNLPHWICRLIVGIGASVLLLVTLISELLLIKDFHTAFVKFGDYIFLMSLFEAVSLFGFVSLFWVSIRPLKSGQMFTTNFSADHARS